MLPTAPAEGCGSDRRRHGAGTTHVWLHAHAANRRLVTAVAAGEFSAAPVGLAREQPSRSIGPLASEAVIPPRPLALPISGQRPEWRPWSLLSVCSLRPLDRAWLSSKHSTCLAVWIMWAPTRRTFAASTLALGIMDRVSESQTAFRLLAGRDAAVVAYRRVASSPAGMQCPAPRHAETSSLCWATARA